MQTSRETQFIPIPPGTHATECRYCRKEIYFAPHPTTRKPHPVSVESHVMSEAPTRTTWGKGVTHMADRECPRPRPPLRRELAGVAS